ncbi:hypothetical protein MRX96_059209 [Rhipicephalus microplus]
MRNEDFLGYNDTGIAQDEVVSEYAEESRRLLAPSSWTLEIANATVLNVKLNALPEYVQALEDGFGAYVVKANVAGAGLEAGTCVNYSGCAK